jgi:hypothetical protein
MTHYQTVPAHGFDFALCDESIPLLFNKVLLLFDKVLLLFDKVLLLFDKGDIHGDCQSRAPKTAKKKKEKQKSHTHHGQQKSTIRQNIIKKLGKWQNIV